MMPVASSAYRIHVAKEYLGFCAGHFITYDGHQCEALHGHNYRVRLTLAGPLDENAYVLDFSRVKRLIKQVCDPLDHRMLLPLENRLLTLLQSPESIEVQYKQRRYVFPRADVALLPIPNTTAEMLATYLAGQVRAALSQHWPLAANRLHWLELEVEEAPGQAAIYREEFTPTEDNLP